MLQKALWGFVGACLVVAPVQARLGVGDTAPPLKIKEWVQGAPVELGKGNLPKFYLVEFWATWCPPCKASVPLLTNLQKKHENDLVVIGVSDPDDRGNTPAEIRRFVKQMGREMTYTVAIDDTGKTTDDYMLAAGAMGIPHAFLVGRDGKIVWQGSPLDPALDDIVSQAVAGRYDVSAAKREAEVMRRLEALRLPVEMGQWAHVWDGLVDIVKIDPTNEVAVGALVNIYAHELRNTGTFRRWVRSFIDEERKNSLAMRRLAAALLDIEDLPSRLPDLTLEAARAAYDASRQLDVDALAIYARALYHIGDLDRAIKMQRDALTLALDSNRREMQRTLEYYEKCKELQATLK